MYNVDTVDEVDLTVYADDGLTVTGSGTYDPCDTVTLVAAVEEGTQFAGWYTSDGELIETMAELLRFESKAAEVPEGEADYVLTVECGGEERSFSVWDVDGGLVCSPDDGRAWNAAGTAEAFAEAAG